MKGGQSISATSPGSTRRLAPVLVLGLGNPILGDDGVGWKVAEEVRSRLEGQQPPVEIDCASLGGLSLMERMLGYDRAIVIDAIETGQYPIGHVSRFPLQALSNPTAGHTASAHDTSLLTALESARALGETVPSQIDIIAIEVEQRYDFSEQLTPAIQAAVGVATRKVLEALRE